MPLIDPSELIARYPLEEHLRFADDYFKGREEHLYLYQKPFYHPQDCAPLVTNVGQLLAGAQLESGMRVLEFAAGSCWLGRLLAQLGCVVTCSDASATALEIGKVLFAKYPPVAPHYPAPTFSVFGGARLDFADASFDRVIVNDAFHHVPNIPAILAEFHRVLDDDGVVAMSEPGRSHSRSEASQYEMSTFSVLENDIVLEDLWRDAREVGFRDIRICPVLRQPQMNIEEYLACINGDIPARVTRGLIQDTFNHSIFFLHKQPVREVKPIDVTIPRIMLREDFDEAFYLEAYPDVVAAIGKGLFADAWQHYERHGRDEGRRGKPR